MSFVGKVYVFAFRGSSIHVLLPNVTPSVLARVHGGFPGGNQGKIRVRD